MVHAHCMLYNSDYKYTLRVCNNNCFSTGRMVARMRHNATLYKHCLYCFIHYGYPEIEDTNYVEGKVNHRCEGGSTVVFGTLQFLFVSAFEETSGRPEV